MLVDRINTPWTDGELEAAYRAAWRAVFGGEASDAATAFLCAQSTLECGWGGKGCRNNNPSNMTRGQFAGDYFVASAPECVDPAHLPRGATVLAASQVVCAPGAVPYLPAEATQWRSYPSLLDGCIDKLKRLLDQWPAAIVALQVATSVDDAFAFVRGLYPGPGRNYATASEAAYLASVRDITGTFLKRIAEARAPKVKMIEAHLPNNLTASRRNVNARAYRLFETDMPVHDGTPESTLRIVAWLGVERHERWRAGTGITFCNVYAHDLCALLGAYVPRVFWLPAAIAEIQRGKQASVRYATTVGELSANMLFVWLVKWGADFDWRRTTLDEAQSAANAGRAAVICARRRVDSQPGHISVVVPESERCRALRDAHGVVSRPVQSQAGQYNVELGTLERAWWTNADMAEWGAWVHEPPSVRDTDPAPAPSSGPPTEPQTPTSKSSGSMRAVVPTAATPLRGGPGERTPAHLRDDFNDLESS